jgi:hypothetical protein
MIRAIRPVAAARRALVLRGSGSSSASGSVGSVRGAGMPLGSCDLFVACAISP